MWRFLGFLWFSPLILIADSGFYSAKAYRIPSAVEQASNSVVKIIVLDSATHSPFCTGTGFVVEDSMTLWTAGHVVLDPHVQEDNLQIQLQDTLGRTIFDTTSGDSAKITLMGKSDGSFASNEAKDYAKITLSRPLALRPLVINPSIPKTGQELFSAGFPAIDSVKAPTRQSVRDGLPQSRVTTGKAITASEATEKIAQARSPAESGSLDKSLATKMIFIDSDGYFGQSGAPIFNEDGEVVGIFTAIIRSLEPGLGVQINTKGLGPNFSSILTP